MNIITVKFKYVYIHLVILRLIRSGWLSNNSNKSQSNIHINMILYYHNFDCVSNFFINS